MPSSAFLPTWPAVIQINDPDLSRCNNHAGRKNLIEGSGMLRQVTMAAIVAACVTLPAQQSRAQFAGDPSAGQEVARRWCSNCHVVDAQQRRGSDVVPTFETIANRRSTSAATLTAFLNMPHWRTRMPDLLLSTPDRDNVVAYLLSLRRPPS